MLSAQLRLIVLLLNVSFTPPVIVYSSGVALFLKLFVDSSIVK